MKFFGRKSAAAGEARPPLSCYGGGGAALGDWPRSYEAQVRSGYLENAIARRSVRLVAEGVADAPIGGSSPELVALIEARSSGQALLDTVAAQLMLHGNAFIQVLEDGRGGVGELFALRPERVTVEADANGWPAAYRYRVADRVTRLSPDADALVARFRDGGWMLGAETATSLNIGGNQVVGERMPAIVDPTGGAVVDVESRAALGGVLAALRAHGLIES